MVSFYSQKPFCQCNCVTVLSLIMEKWFKFLRLIIILIINNSNAVLFFYLKRAKKRSPTERSQMYVYWVICYAIKTTVKSYIFEIFAKHVLLKYKLSMIIFKLFLCFYIYFPINDEFRAFEVFLRSLKVPKIWTKKLKSENRIELIMFDMWCQIEFFCKEKFLIFLITSSYSD